MCKYVKRRYSSYRTIYPTNNITKIDRNITDKQYLTERQLTICSTNNLANHVADNC